MCIQDGHICFYTDYSDSLDAVPALSLRTWIWLISDLKPYLILHWCQTFFQKASDPKNVFVKLKQIIYRFKKKTNGYTLKRAERGGQYGTIWKVEQPLLYFLLVFLLANFKIWSNMEHYEKWWFVYEFSWMVPASFYLGKWENTKFSFSSLVDQLQKFWGCPRMILLSKREWEIWRNMESGATIAPFSFGFLIGQLQNIEQYGAIWKVGQPFPHDLFTFGISLKVAYA